MLAGQTMRARDGYQVALFPLEGFHISQTDYGTYSHGGGAVYWATDYLGYNSNGRVLRDPCYAPVDIKLIWKNRTECVAVWESLNPVHLANGMLDYLTITCYHDNDIENNTYYAVGTIKRQGEEFFKTGDGGTATGDHIHLETGYGRYTTSSSSASGTPEYKYHITDYTNPKRLHNYDALFINDTDPIQTPTNYVWKTYVAPTPPINVSKKKFPFVLYARKWREEGR